MSLVEADSDTIDSIFADKSRTVYEIGVNFSRAARNIERWIVA